MSDRGSEGRKSASVCAAWHRLLGRLHRSVFTKLLAVMVAMGLSIPILVVGFFDHVVDPTLKRALEQTTLEYVELLATTSPTPARAKEIAARLELDVRYEGPDGEWATAEGLPTIAEVRARQADDSPSPHLGRETYVVSRPNGASYLFVWKARRELIIAHTHLLLILVVVLIAVVFLAHALLRRLLRPVRWLHDGAARVSEGDLDVMVERRTDDEFGELTAAFNQMVVRVREMVKARDQLLLDVSHELRSPLTRMKVALELAADDEHKRRLGANVVEMEALVTELLELERLRNGHGLLVGEHDLVQLARDAVEACAARAPGVLLESDSVCVRLPIDANKVRRVLDNLLDNALKYSLADSKPVLVRISATADRVMVRVEDDGPGISAEDLPSLFRPFFRGDRSRSRKTGGYGLGLSLCHRIMEAHGGSITAAYKEGRGACFLLSFRKTKQQPPRPGT